MDPVPPSPGQPHQTPGSVPPGPDAPTAPPGPSAPAWGTPAPPPATPIGPPPGPGQPVAPPVPVAPTWGTPTPGGPGGPGVPVGPGPAPQPAVVPLAPKRGRGVVIVGALAAAAGVVAIKVISGLVVGSVVGTALGSFLGGPYQKLPSDVRSGFESRVKTAVGGQLEGMSDSAASARLSSLVQHGLVRLDDQHLVRHLTIQTQALDRADTPSCAGFARASIGGKAPSDAVVRGLMGALETPALQEFMEINIEGLEAEARGSPGAETVTDDQVNPVFDKIFATFPDQDATAIQGLVNGTTTTDEAACHAVRTLYDSALTMAPADLAILARFDVQP